MTAFNLAELSGHVPGLPIADTSVRLRSVECVCGTEITADADHPGPAVRRHNLTPAHLRWWARVGDDPQGEER